MPVYAVKDTEFDEEVINSNIPVLVDFWAEWCGPCQAFAPVMEELAGEMDGKVKMVKVNIEESPNSPTKYGVRSIPTLLIFKAGEVVAQRVGAMGKEDCKAWLESSI